MTVLLIDKGVISLHMDTSVFNEEQARILQALILDLQTSIDELTDRINDLATDYNAHTSHPP